MLSRGWARGGRAWVGLGLFRSGGRRWTQSNGTKSIRRAELPGRRTGVLAIKVGMMASWDIHGIRHPLTVLHVDGCRVVQVKEKEKHGYTALQVGVCPRKGKHMTRPEMGHFARWQPEEAVEYPYLLLRHLEEFRVSPEAVLPVGQPLKAAHFVPGQFVDVQGTTKGKGFQGTMKRWGFKGQGKSHGNSKAHRAPGSIGMCAEPGRVWKGKKMAGRMGGRRRTIQNLVVHRVDVERDLVYVRGAVPGKKGGLVRLTDSIKNRSKPQNLTIQRGGKVHFPTIPNDALTQLPAVLHYDDEIKPEYYY